MGLKPLSILLGKPIIFSEQARLHFQGAVRVTVRVAVYVRPIHLSTSAIRTHQDTSKDASSNSFPCRTEVLQVWQVGHSYPISTGSNSVWQAIQ